MQKKFVILSYYLLKYPFFCTKIFLTFKLAISLSFPPCNVSYSKQAAVIFSIPHILFPPFRFLPSSRRSDIFIGLFLYLPFVYKALISHQLTVQYWFFSWLGRSSLQFLPKSLILCNFRVWFFSSRLSLLAKFDPDNLFNISLWGKILSEKLKKKFEMVWPFEFMVSHFSTFFRIIDKFEK